MLILLVEGRLVELEQRVAFRRAQKQPPTYYACRCKKESKLKYQVVWTVQILCGYSEDCSSSHTSCGYRLRLGVDTTYSNLGVKYGSTVVKFFQLVKH